MNNTAEPLTRDAPKTIRDINAGLHPYRDARKPDSYVFVYDSDVNMVAYAADIQIVGDNYHLKTDVAGKPFRDLIVQGAFRNGSGWEDYIDSSPAESGLFCKSAIY